MLFDPMFTMGGDMDNILDYMNTPLTMTPFNRKRRSMMGPSLTSGSLVDNQSFHIPLDVYESDKQYVILAQIPGVQKSDINVEVEDRALMIKATRDKDPLCEESTIKYCECSSGHCSRKVVLPVSVNENKPKCTFNNGMLRVCFSKHAASAGMTKKLTIA